MLRARPPDENHQDQVEDVDDAVAVDIAQARRRRQAWAPVQDDVEQVEDVNDLLAVILAWGDCP